MFQHFEASSLISAIPAWGHVDLSVSQKNGSLVRVHCLSAKVAPRSDARRGVLIDATQLSKLVNFEAKASENGNVYLGAFVAIRSHGKTNIAFQPSEAFSKAQLHLSRIFLPEEDFDSVLGGEDDGATVVVTDAPF